MIQSLEPVFLLSAVPGDVAIPVATAGAAAIVALYRNGRKDLIDALNATNSNTAVIQKLIDTLQEKPHDKTG